MNVRLEYEKMYCNTGFERAGLFACIRKTIPSTNVAYIGSSIHICPSFYFRNVSYIDNSKTTSEFFLDLKELVGYIDTRKYYKEEPHIEYINKNYYTELTEYEKSFDLVFCIYAPHSLDPAIGITRIGGTIIYLNMPSDNDLDNEKRVEIVGHILYRDQKYMYHTCGRKTTMVKKKKSRQLFKENNEYLVLKRMT